MCTIRGRKDELMVHYKKKKKNVRKIYAKERSKFEFAELFTVLGYPCNAQTQLHVKEN